MACQPVSPKELETLLQAVAAGTTTVADANVALCTHAVTDLGFACVDHHRRLRQGVGEVVFGEGKSAEQVLSIVKAILKQQPAVLVTRVTAMMASSLAKGGGVAVDYDPIARTIVAATSKDARAAEELPLETMSAGKCGVAIVTAGTSDLPVAAEAQNTLAYLGVQFTGFHDVGVSGIHRVLRIIEDVRRCSLAIVVAGMDGALPTVVAGMLSGPVIAVPTSVGYGIGAGGVAPLLAMLNSCASGMTVVNIDNGFGAAMAAHRIICAQ